jgi:hypothetical protein
LLPLLSDSLHALLQEIFHAIEGYDFGLAVIPASTPAVEERGCDRDEAEVEDGAAELSKTIISENVRSTGSIDLGTLIRPVLRSFVGKCLIIVMLMNIGSIGLHSQGR